MSKYKQSLAILDRLISQLEANTGGQPLFPQQKAALPTIKVQPKENAPKVQKVEAQQKAQKKEAPKKKKDEGNKQPRKKQAKQAQKPKVPEGADQDVLIFADVDLRISQIVDCWKHPDSTYLYCQKILVGKELRHIASGLQECISIENMKGKCIVMANLKPRMLGGFESNGMVVCSSDQDKKFFEILKPQGPLGERLYLQGFEQLFAAGEQIQPIMKKKTLQKCLQHFATDKDGFVTWKGIKVRSKAGYIKSAITEGKVS